VTAKELFGGFCGIIGSACNLHAIHTENETLLVVGPVPPKARKLEVWVWVMSTKTLVKKFWIIGVCLVRCFDESVHSYIGGYVLKYVIKCIVIPCHL
jgi:anthranilate/para-aminobenzoate synthase component II